MLTAAILALTALQSGANIPFHTITINSAAVSPQPPHADLFTTKKQAFDFLHLLRNDAPKPESIKKINWRHDNVIVVYPGLFQADARIKLNSVSRVGRNLRVALTSSPGMSSETRYPVIVIQVSKQTKGTQVSFIDYGKLIPRRKPKHH
jgi:hypothetical protein